MLAHFASYNPRLQWREAGLLLARQFLEFEAGIHGSQMQTQSETTGIDTRRIYSPTSGQRRKAAAPVPQRQRELFS